MSAILYFISGYDVGQDVLFFESGSLLQSNFIQIHSDRS
jgi:hypothetical protein